MGILHLAIANMIISLSTLLSVTALHELGYSVEKYDESPGIYYENKGVAVLYKINIIFRLNGIVSYPCICRTVCHVHGTM